MTNPIKRKGPYDLEPHTEMCEIWYEDGAVCTCGVLNQTWRGKARGAPHPRWLDPEVIRRLHAGEAVGRPVSEREGLAAVPGLVAKGLSVLAMAEAMSVDRRWIDGWILRVCPRSQDMVE